MEAITSQIDFIFTQYPAIKHAVAIYFLLRLINKPLFTILGKYVELTDSKKDNRWYKKVMASKAYKFFAFLMDYGASVKLPKGD